MKQVFGWPEGLLPNDGFFYCPGCGYKVMERIIVEVLDELGIRQQSVGIIGSGCYSNAMFTLNCDVVRVLHGRSCSVAAGVKRSRPESIVFTVQGDGDYAAIGTAEAIHTATRGELITAIMANNACYANTGGQMAPTTLVGQKTTTSPNGRSVQTTGRPIRILEMVAVAEGTAYVARGALNSPANVRRTKQYLKRAFQTQMAGIGHSVVEMLSPCPQGWGLKPAEALKWMGEQVKVYPVTEIKTWQTKGASGS